jgi:hypothetical protein
MEYKQLQCEWRFHKCLLVWLSLLSLCWLRKSNALATILEWRGNQDYFLWSIRQSQLTNTFPMTFQPNLSIKWKLPDRFKRILYSGSFNGSHFFNCSLTFLLSSQYASLLIPSATCQVCFYFKTWHILFVLPGTLSPKSSMAHLLIFPRSLTNSSQWEHLWPSAFQLHSQYSLASSLIYFSIWHHHHLSTIFLSPH